MNPEDLQTLKNLISDGGWGVAVIFLVGIVVLWRELRATQQRLYKIAQALNAVFLDKIKKD